MTFSGDHIEEKTKWSKLRSRITLSIILIVIFLMLFFEQSRGYALMGLALMFTIMMHEFGHFIAAKKTKMKATEFFVGFGPRIWSFKKGETEYGIKAIPLGGYVKIIGMTNVDEIHPDDEHRTYRAGKTWKKLIVIMAGVTVNLIMAFLLIYASLVFRGVPQEAKDTKAQIELASPNSPAEKIGLRPKDIIVKIDDVKIDSFAQMKEVIVSKKVGAEISITYIRDLNTISANVVLAGLPDEKGKATSTAYLGVQPITAYKKVATLKAIGQSYNAIGNVLSKSIGALTDRFSLSGLKDYSQIVANGDYKRQDRPSSIVGIVDSGGVLVNQDVWYLIYIMSIVNIFLALFNVLPLLPLDGGHAAVAIYEGVATKIKKRPVVANFKKLVPLATVVVGAFVLLALTSIWLDILQIAS
jgi:membrane-associated protease RseP (regulator of RpoE activity)